MLVICFHYDIIGKLKIVKIQKQSWLRRKKVDQHITLL